VAAVRAVERHAHWMALVAEGIIGIVAGLIMLTHLGIAILAFAYIFAAWAIITGILELVAAVRLRRELAGELLLVVAGIVSILFGVLIALFPGAGILGVVWLIGIYALIFGVLLVALSFRLRAWHHAGNGGLPATSL
jgi:uncharacterized membrane protein HdeD (DUF308 family)